MTVTGTDLATSDGIPVRLPSGADSIVLSEGEVAYFNTITINYLRDNHFSNQSDLQDLDRVVMYEVLIGRWTNWVSRGKNYLNEVVDEAGLRRSIEQYSGEVRQIKKSLGIDKVSRDRQRGDDSVPVYLDNLAQRAMEFGIMREEQCAKAIELAHSVIAQAILWRNCTEDERREMHVTSDEIMAWLLDVFTPEFEAVDAHFRDHVQRYYIREM